MKTEAQLIDLILERLGPVARDAQMKIGPGDDAAVLSWPSNEDLVVSTDSCVEGIHIAAGFRAEYMGYRAVAMNVSDIVAMGAIPRYLTIALTMQTSDEKWVGAFADGVRVACEHANVTVVGGNLSQGDIHVTMTVLGSVAPGKAVRRNSAQLGDDIWHTGRLGASVLARQDLPIRERRHLSTMLKARDTDPVARYFLPPIRNEFVPCIAECASAATDISDGLETELNELISGSSRGYHINTNEISIWPGAPSMFVAIADDSYELLFTAPTSVRGVILQHSKSTDISVARIGSITETTERTFNPEVSIYSDDVGYSHF